MLINEFNCHLLTGLQRSPKEGHANDGAQ